jgi:hypothetical protein
LAVENKFYKSLKVITLEVEKHNQDPLLMLQQAKYLYKLNLYREALIILQNIKQYNQFETWVLMAEVSQATNHVTDALICLNYASKLIKPANKPNISYKQFESLGKIKKLDPLEELEYFPAYLVHIEEPIVFSLKEKVDDKMLVLPHTAYWKLLPHERMVFNVIMMIR